jgi:hypothetical protein
MYKPNAADAEPSLSSSLSQQQLPIPSINLYTYVANNPLMLVDPRGLGGFWDCMKNCGIFPPFLTFGLTNTIVSPWVPVLKSVVPYVASYIAAFCATVCSGYTYPDGCFPYGSGGGPRGTGIPY